MKEGKAYIGDEIVEGNKLIAEFMSKPNHIMPELLKYHSSWDWLMPVVEKIEKECFKVLISTFGLSDWHYTEIRKGTKHCGYGKSEKKIESTWIAVVDFIKNYNQNKQS